MAAHSVDDPEVVNCILELYRIGVFKFGEFTLKSGIQSPIYFDLRMIVSHPKIMESVSQLMWDVVDDEKYDVLCGVPYTALPLATVLSIKNNIPMVIRRKENKGYGTNKLVEGEIIPQQRCLVIEDVVVSGSSVLETVNVLKDANLMANRAVVFLDREQGGIRNLANRGIHCTAVLSLREMLKILHKHKKIEPMVIRNVSNYLQANRSISALPDHVPSGPSKTDSLKERVNTVSNPLVRKLLNIIDTKKTNLCVAVDYETSEKLLLMADMLGPHICILKTHIDILRDFSVGTSKSLKQLAEKHQFLILEDRKFADIGNTVRMQYSSGLYEIFDWAHLVTVHGISGPGVLYGLKSSFSELPEDRGCLIVAEMSSKGNLIDDQYTKNCVKIAGGNQDFVVGFISQSAINDDPNFVLLTPGVSLATTSDTLAQAYVTPEDAIFEKGADVVIVGRGITSSDDPVVTAMEYKEKSYQALLYRSSS